MTDRPIDCPYLKWSYVGWGCKLTERRRDHHIEKCPIAKGGKYCYDKKQEPIIAVRK